MPTLLYCGRRHMGNDDKQTLFSIGKTAEICGVSSRALRFYEENGLIEPDRVDESNHYRYYSYETMRQIQTVRYLLDEGFTLSQIQEIREKDDPDSMKDHFLSQIRETENQIRYHQQRLSSLQAWCSLLIEGQDVLRHGNSEVTSRFIPLQDFFYFEVDTETPEEQSQAYLETLYFTRSKMNGHSMVDMGGAFYVLFDSFEARLQENCRKIALLQTTYPNGASTDNTRPFGGFTAVSCYHIGPMDDIAATYDRMLKWAEEHRFPLDGSAIERCVLDIYSVSSPEKFVTEVLLPTKENTKDLSILHRWG